MAIIPRFVKQATISDTPEERRIARAKRIFEARKRIESLWGEDVSFREFGEWVARAEGRKFENGDVRAYSSGNVQRWEQGDKAPGVDAMEAIDRLAGLPVGYTAYGERTI